MRHLSRRAVLRLALALSAALAATPPRPAPSRRSAELDALSLEWRSVRRGDVRSAVRPLLSDSYIASDDGALALDYPAATLE